MILSDRDILNFIQRGDIQIEPFDLENLGSNSYDLHLSSTLKVYQDHVLDARAQHDTKSMTIAHDGLVLEPDRVYLGSTVEWTRTRHLVPVLEGKSSMARLGLSVVSDGGFGDVDFEGCWTLELSVKQPVRIYPKMPICQISYMTTGPCDIPYSRKSSARYSQYDEPKEYNPPKNSDNTGQRRQIEAEDGIVFDHGQSLQIPVVQCDDTDDLPLPKRATAGASAVDLIAAVDETIRIESNDVELIDTGIKISLPEGYEAQVRARSGLAQRGIIIPNGPGTIDSDYRGEIKVLLQNLSGKPFSVDRGDRIAQLAVQQVERFRWDPRESLDQTKREDGGFGSTGIQVNSQSQNGHRDETNISDSQESNA